MDLGPAGSADAEFHGGALPEAAWLEPIPDSRVLPADGDPAELAASRETLRLAFVDALQHLPPRQRAVLILREVLRWQASEVAELLDTSVASVNSALQRARAQLARHRPQPRHARRPARRRAARAARPLRGRLRAVRHGRADSLLQEDATLSMPPFDLWLQGADQIRAWFLGHGIGCKGSRLLPVNANGCPGSLSTGRARRAAGSRGRSRCSRSQTGGSPISTRSSTPSGCSRSSGCPPGSTRRTPASPKRSSSSRQLGRGIAQPHPAAEPPRRELKARERLDRPGVRVRERGDVADEHLGARALELRARALAQGRRVGGGE